MYQRWRHHECEVIMHVTSSSAVALLEMSLKQQKSKLKIIFSNTKKNLQTVIRIYWLWWRHQRFRDVTTSKYFAVKILQKSFNKQRIFILSLTKLFLVREANLSPPPTSGTNRVWNSLVEIGLRQYDVWTMSWNMPVLQMPVLENLSTAVLPMPKIFVAQIMVPYSKLI